MVIDSIVDAIFAVDIVMTFFVAYLDKSTYLLVDEHKKIAIRYSPPSFDYCITHLGLNGVSTFTSHTYTGFNS